MHAMPPLHVTFPNRLDIEAPALGDDEIIAAIEAGLAAQGRGRTLHAEMGQIVAGLEPGRETDQETIFFRHRGLSLSDIALAHAMIETGERLGIGQKLRWA
jgi:ornithine cyclodeaminase